jgi:hypothetical protein
VIARPDAARWVSQADVPDPPGPQGEPSWDKLPKGVKSGDLLLGSVTFEKAPKDQPKSKRPKGFKLVYVVPPNGESKSSPKVGQCPDLDYRVGCLELSCGVFVRADHAGHGA